MSCRSCRALRPWRGMGGLAVRWALLAAGGAGAFSPRQAHPVVRSATPQTVQNEPLVIP